MRGTQLILGRALPHGFFLFVLGAFGASHWISYAFNYATASWATHLIGLAGIVLACRPAARPAFLILMAALLVDTAIQAPVYSNHTMLKNFLVLITLCAGAESLLRRKGWDFFIERIAGGGRWLLIGMYFWGVFHKINSDFLDPDVSCATAQWMAMPFPTPITESAFLHVTGIWATFIIEAAIVTLLLLRQTRHLGIFFGIAFHGLLALSGYAYYPTFTLLTIALHCLFLPPRAHLQFLENPAVATATNRLRSPFGILLVALIFAAMVAYAWLEMFVSVALAWLLLVIVPFAYLVLRFGREANEITPGSQRQSAGRLPVLPLRPLWIPAMALLFFFNGATPYLGLKTAQSFNMFANLHLEGGTSNHLILDRAPGPFGYLEEIAEITDSRAVPWFSYIQNNDLRIVYYDLLNHMERAGSHASVSYRMNDIEYEANSREDLTAEFERVLHPRWFRAWFHFTPVDLTSPKPCARDR